MADQNQTQLYRARYNTISTMFQTANTDAAWRALATQTQEALSDTALPRYHRARFHIINAWCIRDPEPQLRAARETLEDMVQVLSQDETDGFLEPLWEMLEVFEASIEKDKAELAATPAIFKTQAGKRKMVRRVDTAGVRGALQEFDKKTQSWVELGDGEDPMAQDEMLPDFEGEPEAE